MAKHYHHLEEDYPHAVRHAYHAQRHSANRRGIGWEITLAEWWAWWQEDGRWERRGMGSDRLVMARHNDAGPYRLGNIKCITHAQNIAEQKFRSHAHKRSWGEDPTRECHLDGKRGDDHPKSRAILTPAGRFGSAALAADHYGKARQVIAKWAREGKHGFSYE